MAAPSTWWPRPGSSAGCATSLRRRPSWNGAAPTGRACPARARGTCGRRQTVLFSQHQRVSSWRYHLKSWSCKQCCRSRSPVPTQRLGALGTARGRRGCLAPHAGRPVWETSDPVPDDDAWAGAVMFSCTLPLHDEADQRRRCAGAPRLGVAADTVLDQNEPPAPERDRYATVSVSFLSSRFLVTSPLRHKRCAPRHLADMGRRCSICDAFWRQRESRTWRRLTVACLSCLGLMSPQNATTYSPHPGISIYN